MKHSEVSANYECHAKTRSLQLLCPSGKCRLIEFTLKYRGTENILRHLNFKCLNFLASLNVLAIGWRVASTSSFCYLKKVVSVIAIPCTIHTPCFMLHLFFSVTIESTNSLCKNNMTFPNISLLFGNQINHVNIVNGILNPVEIWTVVLSNFLIQFVIAFPSNVKTRIIHAAPRWIITNQLAYRTLQNICGEKQPE